MLRRKDNIYGNIGVFKEDVSRQSISETLTLTTSVMLNSKHWALNYRMYTQEKGQQFFKILSKCGANSLKLIHNNCNDIIKHLINVQFVNLKQLQINRNNIQSIQCLQLIDLVELKILRLDSNRIHSIQSLRKLHCPKLQHLQIDKNLIQEMRPLNELECPLMKKIYIQYHGPTISQDSDISWIFKIPSNNIEILSLKSTNRINLHHLQAVILSTHPLLISND